MFIGKTKTVITIIIGVLIALGLTFIGIPFGARDEVYYIPGTIGADHHIFITFFTFNLIDRGHYGFPGAIIVEGYTPVFILNLIIVLAVLIVLQQKRLVMIR